MQGNFLQANKIGKNRCSAVTKIEISAEQISDH